MFSFSEGKGGEGKMILSTAYNSGHTATVLRTSAQIPLRGTSDTPGTLYEIPNPAIKKVERYINNLS